MQFRVEASRSRNLWKNSNSEWQVRSALSLCKFAPQQPTEWYHRFFGIGDGEVQQFKVAKVQLDGEGRFQAQIPDFSKDIVTTQMQHAYLAVLIVQHSGGDRVQSVLPSTDLLYRNVGLKILSSYSSEISFTGR